MQVIIIDRSNLDEVVAFMPAQKRNITRREQIQESVIKYGYWSGRTDILLVNGREKQYAVYPSASGELVGDVFVLDLLEQADYDRVVSIGQRTAALAERDPVAKWLVC